MRRRENSGGIMAGFYSLFVFILFIVYLFVYSYFIIYLFSNFILSFFLLYSFCFFFFFVLEPKLLLPAMESLTNQKKAWNSTKQRSKGIVSAIIDAAKCPEKESLGWVGIEEQHENDIHDTSSITLPTTPPPPPIENDTHIFDLLSKDNTYFIHYSKKNDSITSINSATVEKLVEIITKDIGNINENKNHCHFYYFNYQK